MTILVPHWRARASVTRVLAAFPDPAQVRFVGGCVRDALLGMETNDFDLATTYLPEDVISFMEKAGLKPVATGLSHGTISVFLPPDRFEMTTLRADVTTDGRHATVAFTKDWQVDAARRDFTMNALFLDHTGVLYDYFQGRADLAQGTVRFIGDPITRLTEDALRILRYFRFVLRFQKGDLEAKAKDACTHAQRLLKNLSKERITQEFLQILNFHDEEKLHKVLAEMAAMGLFQTLFSHDPPLSLWQKVGRQETDTDTPLARRLATFFWGNRKALDFLTLPRSLTKQIDILDKYLSTEKDVRVIVYEAGVQTARDWLLIKSALEKEDDKDLSNQEAIFLRLSGQEIPSFPLTGKDLLALGLEGKTVGAYLKTCRRWWIEGNFKASQTECLQHVKDAMGRSFL
ncbi:MAG: CCA tRNA nucleotidyltransferase [Alphaproteobacteria bacterium]|nr:CCA tRNA nucleotidyltransferase [Alphaproteobacteria bacterium]